MKKTSKKLAVSTHTLRNLSTSDLAGAKGGCAPLLPSAKGNCGLDITKGGAR